MSAPDYDILKSVAMKNRAVSDGRSMWFQNFRAIVESDAFRDLSLIETRVLVALLKFSGPDGICWPANKTIRQVAGVTVASRVRAAVKTLEEVGLIRVLHEGGGGGRSKIIRVGIDELRSAGDTQGGTPCTPLEGGTSGTPLAPSKGVHGVIEGGTPCTHKGVRRVPPNSLELPRNSPDARARLRGGPRAPAPGSRETPDVSRRGSDGKGALALRKVMKELGYRPGETA